MAEHLTGPFTQYLSCAMQTQCKHTDPNARSLNIGIFYDTYAILSDFDSSPVAGARYVQERCQAQAEYLTTPQAELAPKDYYVSCIVLECMIRRMIDLLDQDQVLRWLMALSRRYGSEVLTKIIQDL